MAYINVINTQHYTSITIEENVPTAEMILIKDTRRADISGFDKPTETRQAHAAMVQCTNLHINANPINDYAKFIFKNVSFMLL